MGQNKRGRGLFWMISSVSRRFRPDSTRVSCHLPAQNDTAAWSGELWKTDSMWSQDFCVMTLTEPPWKEPSHLVWNELVSLLRNVSTRHLMISLRKLEIGSDSGLENTRKKRWDGDKHSLSACSPAIAILRTWHSISLPCPWRAMLTLNCIWGLWKKA